MRRHMSRIALLLAVLMLQFLMPFEVMALDAPEQEEQTDTVEQTDELLTGHEDEVEFSPEVSALLGSLNDEEQGNSDPELLFELSDKRSESYAKHFLNSDRSFTAVKYPFAVHYQLSEEGGYLDIDNRMMVKSIGEQTEEEILLSSALMGKEQIDTLPFFPTASPIKAAIAPDTGSTYMAAIEHDGHILSWNYEEVHEGLYMEVTGGVTEQGSNPDDITDEPLPTDTEEGTVTDDSQTGDDPLNDESGDPSVSPDDPTDISSDEGEDIEDQEDITEADPEEESMFIKAEPLILIPEDEELTPERDAIRYVASGLAFRNAAEGLSLEYILSSDYMEESIVLDDVTAAHNYHIVYDIGDLTAEQISQNELAFLDDKGEVIFRISAPFMKDSDEQFSSDVTLDILSEKDGKVLVELTPDEDWLLDPARTYPVKIDPFVYQFTKSFDEDAAALYSHPSYPYGTLVIGNDNGVSYGKGKSYVKFTLPTLNKGDMVIGGILEISQYAGSYGYSHVSTPTLRVNAYQVTSSWTASQIISSTGYNNLPTSENTVLDYKDISGPNSNSVHYDFDISRAVKKWYEGGASNYGILLRAENESARALACFIASDNLYYPAYRPLLFVQYLNNRGLESYWTYHEIPIGDSGTLYVNDYTGNPVIIFPLASTPGSYAPASLSLVYNGYMSGELADEYTNPGSGFRLNVQERITVISSSGNELMQKLYTLGYRYIYTDEDGTQHYFEEDSAHSGEYIDEEGLKLKLTTGETAPAYYKLASDDGSYKTFGSSGLLYQIFGKDGVGTITLSYNGGTVSRVTDGAGRRINIATDSSGKVLSVTDPAGRITTFSYYSGSGLASLSYHDGTTVTVNYNGSRLKDIKARNGSRIRLIYQTGTDPHVTNRVVQVTEYDNSGSMVSATAGQYLKFDYSQLNETKFTDRKNTEFYQFDNSGRTVSVRDADGGAAIYKYYADHTGKKSNALMFSAYGEKATSNLLTNHSFENSLAGFTSTGTVTAATDNLYLGSKVGKVTGTGTISQTVSAAAGDPYTFSAYLKTTDIAYAKLKLEFLDSSDTVLDTSETLETDYTVSNYDRFFISAEAPAGTAKARASLVSTAGTVYTDCWQLEKSETLNHYNMLVNSDFTQGISGWTRYRTEDIDGIVTFNTDKALRLYGNTTKEKRAYQSIYIGKRADKKNFLMSAMVRMDSVPLTSGRHAGIGITAHYADGTSSTQWAEANPGVSSWQKVSSVFHFNSTEVITYIDAFVTYAGNANICYFDKVTLSSDQTGTAYVVDEDGNVTSAADNAGHNTAYTYSSLGTVSGIDVNNKNYTFTYETNRPHFIKTAKSTSSDIEFGFTYDTAGNVTQTTVTDEDGRYIKEEAEYSSDKAFVTSKTDGAGNTTEYDYGSDNRGLLRNVTDPEDNTIYYSYNEDNGRMTGMSESGTGTPDIGYTYDTHGSLTQIDTLGTDYTFTYDSFGKNISTVIGNDALVSNAYASYNGNLTKTTYGNGDAKNYVYDSYGRLKSEYLTDSSDNEIYRNTYSYNAFGLIGKVEDGRNGKIYDYSYDLTDRPLKLTISDGTVIQTKYNTDNAVENYTVRFRGESLSTVYGYSNQDNRPASSTFNGSLVEEYVYGSLGRMTDKVDKDANGNIVLKTHYTYVDPFTNDTNRTTALVDTVTCEDGAGDEIYAAYRDYDYDECGRIERIYVKNSAGALKMHSYEYDSKGQLISHYNGEAKETYNYSYDSAGNITSTWIHTDPIGNMPGIDLPPRNYQYANDDWGDRLTSYSHLLDQQTLTYDGMGNLKTIGNVTLDWEGRELTEWRQGTGADAITLTFSYDPDGYRVSKTEDDVTTDYLVSGGRILAQHNGTNGLYFFYDSNGQIQAFSDGIDIYYYIKNAEGDILGIVDTGNGDVVATYSYDDWGVPTVTNYGNSTIGDINPFRYRGYYYDSETGLYYVCHRYYDPSIGRWISPDSVISGVGGSLTGYNLFTYCGNDPINRSDSTGNWPRKITKTIGNIAFWIGKVFNSRTAMMVAKLAYRAYDYQSYHYDVRKILNLGAFPLTEDLAITLGWSKQKDEYARCHQFTANDGEKNSKYLSPGGHMEVIFNSDHTIVMDPRDIGTYNFHPADHTVKGDLLHFRYDILPWIIFGNDDSDPGPIINYVIKIFS
ncbi:MAG: DNRLRE domain-containing protein [Firmicutes bacterium]|nr:DNRLRE domain-containing protein [Lachnospiraceae bacterium]MBQ2305547.1 DNRLRE domain-containing protein [Bacillota bacterium]